MVSIPRVSIIHPTMHREVFEPLCDFILIDRQMPDQLFNEEKPVWLDLSGFKGDFQTEIQSWSEHYGEFEAVILPMDENPDFNVLNIATYQPNTCKVGVWHGEKRHLFLLERACDIVALPYNNYGRMIYVTPETSSKYHLYEFCNLDELRRFPIRSIHTSVPITAAMLGIDLRNRERRPKKLPPFSYDLKMSTEQVDLAVQNIMAIREAVYSHYGGDPLVQGCD